ncbi:MAG TPA: CoA ester lyase [Ramlibacter sp.]|nr:CoA ester lyase [Ramlibacter sp.]
MSQPAHESLGLARSFLFVPANRPDRYAKALACGADAVIVDLEDAVGPADKAAARNDLAAAWPTLPAAQRTRILVRVNAAGTASHADDLALMRAIAPAAVMVPKAESAASLEPVAAACGAACALMPMIESVAGLDAADALGRGAQVIRLVFGNLDFQADVGMAAGPDEIELAAVRMALVLSSRRAGLAAPVDGVTATTQDSAQLERDANRGRRSGFGGKLCIHPSQVAAVNAIFSPSAAEIEWARRVLAAWADSGGGVTTVDGRMVDAPVLRLAQRALAHSSTA